MVFGVFSAAHTTRHQSTTLLSVHQNPYVKYKTNSTRERPKRKLARSPALIVARDLKAAVHRLTELNLTELD